MLAVACSFWAEIFIGLNVNQFSVGFCFVFVFLFSFVFWTNLPNLQSTYYYCGAEQSCCELRFVIKCCETWVNWVVCVFKCSHGWIKMGRGCTKFATYQVKACELFPTIMDLLCAISAQWSECGCVCEYPWWTLPFLHRVSKLPF